MGKTFLQSQRSRKVFVSLLLVAAGLIVVGIILSVAFSAPFRVLVPESELGTYQPPDWWVLAAQFIVVIGFTVAVGALFIAAIVAILVAIVVVSDAIKGWIADGKPEPAQVASTAFPFRDGPDDRVGDLRTFEEEE